MDTIKKKFLDKIYNVEQLYRFVSANKLLGMEIKETNPKSKIEWANYIVNEQPEILENFQHLMKSKMTRGAYNYLADVRDTITDEDLEEYAKLMIIDNYWKGYKNEMIAQQWVIDTNNQRKQPANIKITNGNYKEDQAGIDFIVENIDNNEKTAVSVKSQGFYYQLGKRKNNLAKKLRKHLNEGYKYIMIIYVFDDTSVETTTLKQPSK